MKLWTLYIMVFVSAAGFAQKLSVRISDSTIMIGEPITLSYSLECEKGDSIFFEPYYKQIKGTMLSSSGNLSNDQTELEILEDFDTILRPGKKLLRWKGTYTITCWDSGWVLIPGPRIVIDDSTYVFDDLRFTSSFTKPEKGHDLYDIRENYAEVPQEYFPYSEYILKHWYWIVPIMLSLIAFWLYLRKRRRRKREEEVPEAQKMLSLRARTILAIEALEKEKLWEKERLKDHFVELSYILRSYLTARYSVSLLEKTTHETRLILHQKGLEKETIDVIVLLLSQSDLVKFAKSKPDVISILRVSSQAKQIVAETSPLEFDNVE